MNHKTRKWNFKGNEEQELVISMNSALRMLEENLNKEDQKPSIFLGYADPAGIFQTDPLAADAIADAVRSFQFNYYPPAVGVLEARRAIAKHLSCDLPYQLSPDDVFLTLGSIQAIEIITSIVAQPGANILLPRPGYPPYEANAVSNGLEVRQFDLIPEKGWEVDLDSVEAVADDNTVAMVMINPCNPCGNVFTYQHLKQVAETARKLGVFVISDEAFGLVTFGSNPFVPMGVFGTIVPVLTIGTLSKRWVVPGWRLGWIVTNEPNGFFEESGIVESIKNHLEVTSNPPTFLQGAIPQIFEQVKEDFFSEILNMLRQAADNFYEKIKEIPCLTCPHKPEGCLSAMVKLNLSLLDGIRDDMDFCLKLAEEESLVVLPGITVGLKNWVRITFAADPSHLEDALGRIKTFYNRHTRGIKM